MNGLMPGQPPIHNLLDFCLQAMFVLAGVYVVFGRRFFKAAALATAAIASVAGWVLWRLTGWGYRRIKARHQTKEDQNL